MFDIWVYEIWGYIYIFIRLCGTVNIGFRGWKDMLWICEVQMSNGKVQSLPICLVSRFTYIVNPVR